MVKNLNFLEIEKILAKYWLVILIIFSLPSIWALLVPGFFGASDDLHIGWLYEMHRSLFAGQMPPRFVPDLSFGFGYPLFNFVFPLPFYLGELFHLIGLSLVDSIKLVFGLSLVLSAVSMYSFLKQIAKSNLASFAGSLIYLYAPYRSTDVYDRGALGEALAFVFLPLLALAIYKATEPRQISFRWIGIGSLSLGGLILSHNITTYMFFPFVILLGLANIFVNKSLKGFLNLLFLTLLGLISGIYFWLPALIDSVLVKYDTIFNFIDHFPTLIQLIKPNWSYGASVAGPYDGMSFFLGFVNLAVLILGIISLIINWKRIDQKLKLISIWVITSFLVTLFMMNFRSAFVWKNFPLLPYFQFPWRFLIITTFVTPLLVLVIERLKFNQLIFGGLILGSLITGVIIFRPNDFLGREDTYYLDRYIPVPVAKKEYLEIQEEYLRLPTLTKMRPDKNYLPYHVLEGQVNNFKIVNDLSYQFNTTSQSRTVVDINKYYFPGWNGDFDGIPLSMMPGEPFAQIRLVIPRGDHLVKLKFEETQFKLMLDLLALVGMIASGVLIFIKKIPLAKL